MSRKRPAVLMAAGLAVVTALGLVAPWHILLFAFGSAVVQAFDGPAREALLPARCAIRDTGPPEAERYFWARRVGLAVNVELDLRLQDQPLRQQ